MALQVYCAYHCYTKKNEYYWYFAIIFLPVIGCLAYLFINIIRERDIEKVQENFVTAINPTKKIKDLEKKLKFSETFVNQVALGDAYLEAELFDKAIENYEASLKDVFKNDFYATSKLQEAYYYSTRFNESMACAEKIQDDPKFKKSRAAFLYAMALDKTERVEEAEKLLKTFNAPYSRYQERLELSKFFIRNDKAEQAREILQEIVTESEGMSKTSSKQNHILISKAKELLNSEF